MCQKHERTIALNHWAGTLGRGWSTPGDPSRTTDASLQTAARRRKALCPPCGWPRHTPSLHQPEETWQRSFTSTSWWKKNYSFVWASLHYMWGKNTSSLFYFCWEALTWDVPLRFGVPQGSRLELYTLTLGNKNMTFYFHANANDTYLCLSVH